MDLSSAPSTVVWFGFDLVILYLLLRFGPREFPDLSKRVFYAIFGLALVMAYFGVLFVTYEFDDWDGAYAAFGQNLLMSVLFISMFYRRRSLRGQSIWIATFKMVGTALASLAFFLYGEVSQGSVLLPYLYASILVFDLIYIVMIYLQTREGAIFREGTTRMKPAT